MPSIEPAAETFAATTASVPSAVAIDCATEANAITASLQAATINGDKEGDATEPFPALPAELVLIVVQCAVVGAGVACIPAICLVAKDWAAAALDDELWAAALNGIPHRLVVWQSGGTDNDVFMVFGSAYSVQGFGGWRGVFRWTTELDRHIRAPTPATTRAIKQWLKRAGELHHRTELARLLLHSLLEYSSDEQPPRWGELTKAIQGNKKLLCKAFRFGTEDEQMHLMCSGLFEVQAFCYRHSWPEKLLKNLFYILYECDVVEEDAFMAWVEDVDSVAPGKDRAIYLAHEFLTWLHVSERSDTSTEVMAEEGSGDEEDVLRGHW